MSFRDPAISLAGPFLLIFAVGFFYVSILTLHAAFTGEKAHAPSPQRQRGS